MRLRQRDAAYGSGHQGRQLNSAVPVMSRIHIARCLDNVRSQRARVDGVDHQEPDNRVRADPVWLRINPGTHTRQLRTDEFRS